MLLGNRRCSVNEHLLRHPARALAPDLGADDSSETQTLGRFQGRLILKARCSGYVTRPAVRRFLVAAHGGGPVLGSAARVCCRCGRISSRAAAHRGQRAPIFVMWFGFWLASKAAVSVADGCFFPCLVNWRAGDEWPATRCRRRPLMRTYGGKPYGRPAQCCGAPTDAAASYIFNRLKICTRLR